MEGSLAHELYSESLQLSNLELNPTSNPNNFSSDDVWHDDESIWNGSGEELDKSSDLDREWEKRRTEFYTRGYRDGIIKGKEDAAQEGFNVGYKESVLFGYKWGVVRGVTSALACLPVGLKEKLVETQEKRNTFQSLYESVHSVSTKDALKSFHDDILSKKTEQHSEDVESSSSLDHGLGSSLLGKYSVELQSILRESPELEVHLGDK